MIAAPTHSGAAQQTRRQARDDAIARVLPLVPQLGWATAFRSVLGGDAPILFPGGTGDIVEAFADLLDRGMVAHAAPLLPGMGLTKRVRTLIACRLEIAEPNRCAVRRAIGVLARPDQVARGARCSARTVDTIWHAAGDRSADFAWYTKRAILTGVYTSTLLFWLRPDTDHAASLAFLDRRLSDVGRIQGLRSRGSRRRGDSVKPHPPGEETSAPPPTPIS